MSRSYKKYPCWSAPDSRHGVHSYIHDMKKIANRKARRPWNWDTPSGGAYKLITNPWDIRDFKSVYYTRQDVDRAIENHLRQVEGRDYPHERSHHWSGVFHKDIADRFRKYGLYYYYYSK